MSVAVPNFGLSPPDAYSETAGELRMTVGRAEIRRWRDQSLTYYPNPEYLTNPETCKAEEMRTHLVESVVTPGLEYAEEEKATEAGMSFV